MALRICNRKRLTIRRIPTLLIASLMVSLAAAQHMNEPGVPCRDVGPTASQTRCFFDEARRVDAELNTIYLGVQKALSTADQEKLRTAQRLWVQFRDANCAAERDLYHGGSAAPTAYAACLAADTRQRTAELKTMYAWRLDKK